MKFYSLAIAFLCYFSDSSAQTFTASSTKPIVYEMLEFKLQLQKNGVANPFTDVSLSATISTPSGKEMSITGFCDAQNGLLYKIRFMPIEAGNYSYSAKFISGNKTKSFSGNFFAADGKRKGMVQVDKENPWHFKWSNGEHYFYFGTTCYWIMGWKDEQIIRNAIDRFAKYKVNRLRVTINARQDDGKRWSEPLVKESKNFTFKLNPWVAARPDDLDDPGFDVTRFNVTHWQKLDRLVAYAKEKNIIVSLIFYTDGLDHGCDPFKKANMGNDDEKRYYAYAAARYNAYSNVMWDVTNEYHLFRNEAWAEKMGSFLKSQDPYGHCISIHGHGNFPFRNANWTSFVMFQNWDECANNNTMINYRKTQEASGIIKPQVDEEYGYEGHYPPWGCGTVKVAPGRSAENRVDLAWQMYMAGCYQTTGERANEGTGAGKDEGGGWINGRGNASMRLFELYDIMYETFTSLQWWKMNPHNELVNGKNLCLAEPGKQYLVYTNDSTLALQLESGKYKATLISTLTGEQTDLGKIEGSKTWNYPPLTETVFHTAGTEGAKNKDEKKYYPLEGHWVIKLVKE
jgi:hypothetical protein